MRGARGKEKNLPHVINCHNGNSCIPSQVFNPKEYFIQVAFIDPGIVNCGIRIVKLYYKDMYIENVFMELFKFAPKNNIVEGSVNCLDMLSVNLDHFINCHYIVVESQMHINPTACRIAQHLISYLMISTRNRGSKPIIVEVDSSLKIVGLGGPRIKSEVERKKWCKVEGAKILKRRKDKESLEIINGKKKKDDLFDTVCYEQAWWSYFIKVPEIPKSKSFLKFYEKYK